MFDDRLEEIADLLDISEEIKSEIKLFYEEITRHLCREDSEIYGKNLSLYPQGSFRIGTVVSPCGRSGEVDVDIVCCLQHEKSSVSKKELKEMVGRELKKLKYEGVELSESRRCWVLNLQKNIHVDVLPCIPNEDDEPNGILLTDKELKLWQKSAPRDYSEWYLDICKRESDEITKSFSQDQKAEIEKFSDINFKTLLQKATQVLKRHRDVKFKHDLDNRPPSILLTTILAMVNQSGQGIFEKLVTFSEKALDQIKYENGKYCLSNPVVPDENFVDKWNEYSERRTSFIKWIDDLKVMLKKISLSQDLTVFDQILELEEFLGDTNIKPSEQALKSLDPADVPAATSTLHAVIPTWPPANNQYKAKIKGRLYSQNKRFPMWFLSHRSVPTNYSLKFIMETNSPKPYQVYWQIINTGQEALNKNQLRGNIEKEPSVSRWETTSYRGTHFVKGYVIKDGKIIAASQKTVRIK